MKRFAVYLTICLALVLGAASCSTSRRGVRAGAESEAKTYISGQKMNRVQKEMVQEAVSWEGTPYKYGCAEKGKGTDCSGMVLSVYRDVAHVSLPRNSARQAEYCRPVKAKNVKPCDLVFFATGRDPEKVTHVGMMLDDVCFIHASSKKGVCVSRLDNAWYAERLLGFGHVPDLDD